MNTSFFKISVVVPVYFNQDSLPQLCDQLDLVSKQCLEKEIQTEVIFVDDGSKDSSLDVLLKLKDKGFSYAIKIIALARNFGSTVAIRTGLKNVSGNCAITLSADLQDPPSIIPEMIDGWLQGNKFVICTRRTRKDPLSSKIFSFLFYRFVRGFILQDYPLGGFDMALMDEAILPFLLNSSSQLFTPIQVYWLGFRPKVIYYDRLQRLHGKSKWSISKKISLFIDSVLSFSVKPARLFSLFGIVISFSSFLYSIYIISFAFLMGTAVPGFASTMAVMTFLFAIVIALLSLIIEYLSRIFYLLSCQPEVVIESIYE